MGDPTGAELFKVILEWIKAPWKIFAIIFLFSLTLIVVKPLFGTSMNAFITERWPWLISSCLISGFFLVVSAVEHYWYKPVADRRKNEREAQARKLRLEHILRTLKNDELGILRYYTPGFSTQAFSRDQKVVLNLVNKGILCGHSDQGEFMQHFSLTDDVTAYLAGNNFDSINAAIEKLKNLGPNDPAPGAH